MKKFLGWIRNNFIGIISLFSSAIGGAAMAIWRSVSKVFSILDWVLIGILLAESLVFIIFAFWRKFSYKSYHYPSGPIKPSFVILNQELNYKVLENSENVDFTSDKKIKCCDDRLPSIQGKFIWTGDTEAKLPKNQTDYEFLPVTKKGIWTFFEIHFHECLLKGQERDIKTQYSFEHCKTSSPFLSATTEEPTKHISFHIELGDFVSGTEATFEEYRSTEGAYPINSKRLPIKAGGVIDYEIKYPKRFRHYKISWNWKQNK